MQCSINQRRLCINNNNYESKMHTKLFGCLVFVILICFCDGMYNKKKVKRKIGGAGDVKNRLHFGNVTEKHGVDSRGFLSHGGIFSLGKVLNFFPVGGERECQPSGFTIARAGICLNPYDCRQRDGKASGDCAHGLGVCCVFEVTCGGTVQNNLTYFMSPRFPELWTGEMNCSIQIEKSHAGIMQLRVDFVHFTIGQPNRLTGECDEDEMVLGEGATNFTLCGQNHGQHMYYTLSSSETREAGELPHSRATPLVVRMRGGDMPRLWLLRLAQMPLAQSSPHNCMQFHIENNGTIKTFNYASNGRHLAAQEYRACVRRNIGFCSIRYTPCDNRSFRIGPRGDSPLDTLSTDQMDQIMPVDDEQSQEGEEGSGSDPQIDETSSTPQPSLMARIWSYIWPFGGQRAQRAFWSWSPYMQHYSEDKVKYYGYGNYAGSGFGRQRCTDRVTIPCENEYFVSSQLFGPGVCDPHHCGNSFCPGVRPQDCRVETSISPFAVSMHFGAPTFKQNPEENIGMCLRYTQVPCES